MDSVQFSSSRPLLWVQQAFWNITPPSQPPHRWKKRIDGYAISVLHGLIIHSQTIIRNQPPRQVSTTVCVANHTHLSCFVGPYHCTIVLLISAAGFRSTKTVLFLYYKKKTFCCERDRLFGMLPHLADRCTGGENGPTSTASVFDHFDCWITIVRFKTINSPLVIN